MSQQSTRPILANSPSDKSSPAASVAYAVRRALMDVDGCLPAVVLEYDRVRNIATIKPAINKVMADRQILERVPIYEVPCLSNGAGGFHLSFPIVQGTLGWIVATDRDISLFKQSLSLERPNTARIHTFADSWFVPDVMRQYIISSEDEGCAVLQNTEGTVKVVLAPDQARVVVGSSRIVVTDGSVEVITEQATIDAAHTTFTGSVDVEGNMTVQGSATMGSVSSPAAGSFGGISTTAHHHTDAEGRPTGGAQA